MEQVEEVEVQSSHHGHRKRLSVAHNLAAREAVVSRPIASSHGPCGTRKKHRVSFAEVAEYLGGSGSRLSRASAHSHSGVEVTLAALGGIPAGGSPVVAATTSAAAEVVTAAAGDVRIALVEEAPQAAPSAAPGESSTAASGATVAPWAWMCWSCGAQNPSSSETCGGRCKKRWDICGVPLPAAGGARRSRAQTSGRRQGLVARLW